MYLSFGDRLPAYSLLFLSIAKPKIQKVPKKDIIPGSSSLHDHSSCGTLAPFASVVVAAAESSGAAIVHVHALDKNGLDGRRCMDLKHNQAILNSQQKLSGRGPCVRWKGSMMEK